MRTLHSTFNNQQFAVAFKSNGQRTWPKQKIHFIHNWNVNVSMSTMLHCTNRIDENRKVFWLNWNWTNWIQIQGVFISVLRAFPPNFRRKNRQIALFVSCINNYINRSRRSSSNISWAKTNNDVTHSSSSKQWAHTLQQNALFHFKRRDLKLKLSRKKMMTEKSEFNMKETNHSSQQKNFPIQCNRVFLHLFVCEMCTIVFRH